MVPVVGILGMLASAGLHAIVSFFARRPSQENENMRNYRKQKEQEEKEREREKERVRKEEREREKERVRKEEREKEKEKKKMKELEARNAQLNEMIAESERKRVKGEMTRQKEQEAAALAEKKKRVIQQEEQELQDKINERKTREDQERIAKQKESEHRESIIQAEKIREEQARASRNAQAAQLPTEEEYYNAREKVQYNPENFHFAIAGNSGTGKSSLINAFLNRTEGDAGAAETGDTETTLEITRYPDPGTQAPRPWTVWYDIPGAGTQRVSHHHYFTNQALFVFDIIILAIGDRILEADCEIVRSCREFKIPCFIVRSKADQHIRNNIEARYREYRGPYHNIELFREYSQRFVERTQKSVEDELRRAHLKPQKVFCVSRWNLQATYNNALERANSPPDLLDEVELVKSLMLAAYQRRCSGDIPHGIKLLLGQLESTLGWARAACSDIKGSIGQKRGAVEQPGGGREESIAWASAEQVPGTFHPPRENHEESVERDSVKQMRGAVQSPRNTHEESIASGSAEQVLGAFHPPKDNHEESVEGDSVEQMRGRAQPSWNNHEEPMSKQSRNPTGQQPNQGTQERWKPDVTWQKRILHLNQETTANKLEEELLEKNPDLCHAFSNTLHMLSHTTAILFFHQGSFVPQQVRVFGRNIKLAAFQDRGNGSRGNHRARERPTYGGNEGRGGRGGRGMQGEGGRGGRAARGGRGGRGGRGSGGESSRGDRRSDWGGSEQGGQSEWGGSEWSERGGRGGRSDWSERERSQPRGRDRGGLDTRGERGERAGRAGRAGRGGRGGWNSQGEGEWVSGSVPGERGGKSDWGESEQSEWGGSGRSEGEGSQSFGRGRGVPGKWGGRSQRGNDGRGGWVERGGRGGRSERGGRGGWKGQSKGDWDVSVGPSEQGGDSDWGEGEQSGQGEWGNGEW